MGAHLNADDAALLEDVGEAVRSDLPIGFDQRPITRARDGALRRTRLRQPADGGDTKLGRARTERLRQPVDHRVE